VISLMFCGAKQQAKRLSCFQSSVPVVAVDLSMFVRMVVTRNPLLLRLQLGLNSM